MERDRRERSAKRELARQVDEQGRKEQEERRAHRELHSYDRVFDPSLMQDNSSIHMSVEDYEDSFM